MKRTGLSRSSSLPPGSGPSRRVSLRAVSAKREAAGQPRRRTQRDTGFSRAVKLQIRTRAGNGDPDEARCEATGVWLGRYGGEIQHRVARGMGGTSDPAANSIVNAVLLSCEAHRLAESRDDEMNVMGFWLRNGQDPLATPIRRHGRSGGTEVFYLAADGLGPDGTGYLTERPEAVAA